MLLEGIMTEYSKLWLAGLPRNGSSSANKVVFRRSKSFVTPGTVPQIWQSVRGAALVG